jgi:hypothetical protein
MGGGLIQTSRAVALAVRLHQRAGVAGVGFQVQHAVGVGVEHRVALDLLVAGQADHGALARRLPRAGWLRQATTASAGGRRFALALSFGVQAAPCPGRLACSTIR